MTVNETRDYSEIQELFYSSPTRFPVDSVSQEWKEETRYSLKSLFDCAVRSHPFISDQSSYSQQGCLSPSTSSNGSFSPEVYPTSYAHEQPNTVDTMHFGVELATSDPEENIPQSVEPAQLQQGELFFQEYWKGQWTEVSMLNPITFLDSFPPSIYDIPSEDERNFQQETFPSNLWGSNATNLSPITSPLDDNYQRGQKRRHEEMNATSFNSMIPPFSPTSRFILSSTSDQGRNQFCYLQRPTKSNSELFLFKNLFKDISSSSYMCLNSWDCYFFSRLNFSTMALKFFGIYQPRTQEVKKGRAYLPIIYSKEFFYIQIHPAILPPPHCICSICISFLFEKRTYPGGYYFPESLNKFPRAKEGYFYYEIAGNTRLRDQTIVADCASTWDSDFIIQNLPGASGKCSLRLQVLVKENPLDNFQPFALFYSPPFFIESKQFLASKKQD